MNKIPGHCVSDANMSGSKGAKQELQGSEKDLPVSRPTVMKKR